MAVTLEELFKASPRREFQSSNSKGNNNNDHVYNKTTRSVIKNKSVVQSLLVQNGEIISSSRITTTQNGRGRSLKLKILVKKQDLEQMLESIDDLRNHYNNNEPPQSSSSRLLLPSSSSSLLQLTSMETRMNELLRRRRRVREAQQEHHKSRFWRPALHSIPEDRSLHKI